MYLIVLDVGLTYRLHPTLVWMVHEGLSAWGSGRHCFALALSYLALLPMAVLLSGKSLLVDCRLVTT